MTMANRKIFHHTHDIFCISIIHTPFLGETYITTLRLQTYYRLSHCLTIYLKGYVFVNRCNTVFNYSY
jgi:hypothetical protein